MDLKEAGLYEGISEVIATTRSVSGVPNAAPIGILCREDEGKDAYFVNLYKGSQTLSNVMETGELAANVTDDALLFVKAAFDNLDESHFARFSGFPVLKSAESWIKFECHRIEERADSFLFLLTPLAIEQNIKVKVKVKVKAARAINRGLNAVIEATILATRYAIAIDEREKDDMNRAIERYTGIVEKCGGHREKEAIDCLKRLCNE
ncbi:MAG: DUF447 domain-containing protein [Halobacteriota archaeon]